MILPFVKLFCKIPESSDEDILRAKIEVAKRDMEHAAFDFEQVTDPCLIDSCIFELNAAQMRYKYLLQQAKAIQLSSKNYEGLCFLAASESHS